MAQAVRVLNNNVSGFFEGWIYEEKEGGLLHTWVRAEKYLFSYMKSFGI